MSNEIQNNVASLDIDVPNNTWRRLNLKYNLGLTCPLYLLIIWMKAGQNGN